MAGKSRAFAVLGLTGKGARLDAGAEGGKDTRSNLMRSLWSSFWTAALVGSLMALFWSVAMLKHDVRVIKTAQWRLRQAVVEACGQNVDCIGKAMKAADAEEGK